MSRLLRLHNWHWCGLARLLNWIAVVMLVVLGAAGDHSPSVGYDLHADHHVTTAFAADAADHTVMTEGTNREGDSAIHCGAPMLGLAPMAEPAQETCRLLVLQPRFATLLGMPRHPEPEPPRPTA